VGLVNARGRRWLSLLGLGLLGPALGLGLGGCKTHGSAKLEGHWRGVRAEGVAPPYQDGALAFATATEIVARGDKVTITAPGAKGSPYLYTVDEETKTTLTIHTERDGAAGKETFAFSEDGKTMTWRLGDGRMIAFQKQKD